MQTAGLSLVKQVAYKREIWENVANCTVQEENQTTNHSSVVKGDFTALRKQPRYQTGSSEQLLYVELNKFSSQFSSGR